MTALGARSADKRADITPEPELPFDGLVDGQADGLADLARARAFAEPLLRGQLLDTGEEALPHAEGVAAILAVTHFGDAGCVERVGGALLG